MGGWWARGRERRRGVEESSTNERCVLVMVDKRPENGREGGACGWLGVWSCLSPLLGIDWSMSLQREGDRVSPGLVREKVK